MITLGAPDFDWMAFLDRAIRREISAVEYIFALELSSQLTLTPGIYNSPPNPQLEEVRVAFSRELREGSFEDAKDSFCSMERIEEAMSEVQSDYLSTYGW